MSYTAKNDGCVNECKKIDKVDVIGDVKKAMNNPLDRGQGKKRFHNPLNNRFLERP